jgi:hypothetical protein
MIPGAPTLASPGFGGPAQILVPPATYIPYPVAPMMTPAGMPPAHIRPLSPASTMAPLPASQRGMTILLLILLSMYFTAVCFS